MQRAIALVGAVAVFAAPAASAASRPSGIIGRVTEGPTCPVERIPPDPQCSPRPVVARLEIQRNGSRWATMLKTRTDGSFRLRLAPGTYTVRAHALSTSPFPRVPARLVVRVRPHHFTRVTLTYDTGIR